MKQNDNITWLQFNNTVPLIGSAIMIAGAFFALKSDVALLSQKLDRLSDDTKLIISDNREASGQLNNHETRITVLENKKTSEIKSVSQLASKISPFPSPMPSPSQSALPVIQPETESHSSAQVNIEQEPQSGPAPQESVLPTIIPQVIDTVDGLIKKVL